MAKRKNRNWVVRVYDYDTNALLATWKIVNRTEGEAAKEAESYIAERYPEGDVDWTVMPK